MSTERIKDIVSRYGINSLLALVVMGGVAGVFSSSMQSQRWASLSEFHAHWDIYTNTVELSVVIDKQQECRRTAVSKNLRPLIGNDVLPVEIPLNGGLPAKFRMAPLGTSIVFDRAQPRSMVPPGHYLLTMVAFCELSKTLNPKSPPAPPAPPLADPTVVQPTADWLRTEPIETLVIVPEIPVKPIPKS